MVKPEDSVKSEWPTKAFHINRKRMIGRMMLFTTLLIFIYLLRKISHHPISQVKAFPVFFFAVVLSLLIIAAFGFIYLLIEPNPPIKFDISGIYFTVPPVYRKKYVKTYFMPWSNVKHIDLVDRSPSRIFPQWYVRIFFEDGVSIKYYDKMNKFAANNSHSIWLDCLEEKPSKIFTLMRAYFAEGKQIVMR